MKTVPRQALTAADIEAILAENVEGAICSNQTTPNFVWDYLNGADFPERPEWVAAALRKRAEKKRKNGEQDLRQTERGCSGDPTLSDASPAKTSSCVLAPVTNRGNTTLGQELAHKKLGGYDGGCEVGFDGKWDQSLFAELKEKLEQAKDLIAETENDIEAVIGGQPALIKPHGSKVGNNCYSFVFIICGITFFIHRNPKGGIQPVRVRYSASALIQNNLFSVHAQAVTFLSSLGFTVTKEKISRLDLQIMVEHKTSEFIKPILSDCAVRRSTTDVIYRKDGDGQTYTLGKGGDLEMCIYDKKADLRRCLTEDPIKFQLTIDHCVGWDWFADSDRPITRVEFRLWRTALRFLDINSIDDLRHKEQGLIDWLTLNWFRILAKPKVKGHEFEAALHPLWIEVREAFHCWFSGISGEHKPVEWKRPAKISCSAPQLLKQGLGCIAKVAALMFGKQGSADKVQRIFHSLLDSHLPLLSDKMNDIAKRLEVLRGVRLGLDGHIPVFAGSGGFDNYHDWYGEFRLRR